MRNRIVHKFTLTTLLGVFALGTLTACGIKGELKTPPPLWGDQKQVDQNQADIPSAEKQNSEKSKQESNN